jgi:hypothetical protein
MRALVLLAVAATVVQSGAADCSRKQELRVVRRGLEHKEKVAAANTAVQQNWAIAYEGIDVALRDPHSEENRICHSDKAGLSHRAPALRQTGLCSEASAPVKVGLCPR